MIGGKECSLKYEKINEHFYNFKMIFVPKNLRGQGIAARIMDFAMNYARKNMIRVKASCAYVEHYLNTHLEHTNLQYKKEELVFE
jgi:predicted GNAT family acetyltransferase